MAITSAVFAVDDSPIVALNTVGGAGQRIIVHNGDAAEPVYLGASDVSAATGFLLPFGQTVTVDLEPNEVLYALSTAAGASVSVLRNE
jgi:hypothetical protein